MSAAIILEEIVDSRRQQLDQQKSSMPLESFRNQLEPSDRDFAAALRSPRPGFILECKKASPSQGLIRSDFDLVSIAQSYGQFASAISVLTEAEYFRGSLTNLGVVRQYAQQPLLCKDFLVDPYQIFQARHFGADAVLLILAILDDQKWTELSRLASSLNMAVLTEVSNEIEQQRAINLGASIVGINNRNLRDMSIDLQTTRHLASGLPDGTLVVSESGYHTNQQTRSMTDCADAFLIGSSLMAEADLMTAVKIMIFGHCKVCGLTSNDDAIAASKAGAAYGGVIFAEASPRRVTPDDVDEIFHDTGMKRVGVFQDQTIDQIVDVVGANQLDVIQLHGDESTTEIQELAAQPRLGCEIWKALSVHQLQEQAEQWFTAGVSKLLVDNQSTTQKGGTGHTFDWSLLPQSYRDRIIVAGGIGPENAAAAMALGCAGVDMNSSLEETPGKKSWSKIKHAFRAIRNY